MIKCLPTLPRLHGGLLNSKLRAYSQRLFFALFSIAQSAWVTPRILSCDTCHKSNCIRGVANGCSMWMCVLISVSYLQVRWCACVRACERVCCASMLVLVWLRVRELECSRMCACSIAYRLGPSAIQLWLMFRIGDLRSRSCQSSK